ncbi:stage II sporulation protein P [Alkaliphilus hydrothermalis]|uniref:Stage II sporulation protein P n=1 Tax=Alkaliphilus hydrothermalis TaxID=1482730 RepID=A0ABS2NNZ7_9FIRM|nr:stage II sporulation protein P [Alkaliphilus hydrothermalis]MBM7614669.1 stage II sporulation protein P [Alkaliphilus hydrothermalis]
MSNLQKKLVRDYQNIIILVLLLAVFFSLGRLIFEQRALAASNQLEAIPKEKISKTVETDKQGEFLQRAINHVFPAGGSADGKGPIEAIKGIYESVMNNVFFIDLSNPYTFVRSQLPGINTYNKMLALQLEYTDTSDESTPVSIPNIVFENIDGTEETDKTDNVKEIGGSNGDSTEVSQEQVGDRDDQSELEEGIYVPGTEEVAVIDSLTLEGELSLENLPIVPEKIKFEKDKPHILIYHAHGSESYLPATEDNFHSTRKQYTVIAAGEIIKKELEKQGFNVIHETTFHSYPSKNGSYARSLVTASEILKKNPSIKVVLDLHRDGYDNVDSSPHRESIIKNNQVVFNNLKMTKFQFVIGPENPNRKKLEDFAHYVKTISDYRYPGLSKPVLVKPYGKFNQFLVDHYALLELGSNVNTIEEAKLSAQYFAEVFAEALKLLEE